MSERALLLKHDWGMGIIMGGATVLNERGELVLNREVYDSESGFPIVDTVRIAAALVDPDHRKAADKAYQERLDAVGKEGVAKPAQ